MIKFEVGKTYSIPHIINATTGNTLITGAIYTQIPSYVVTTRESMRER